MSARFLGQIKTIWLQDHSDDRNRELVEDFAYVDGDGNEWKASQGSIISGASIPDAFWSVIGPPFVGNYRRASVVHDVACEQQMSSSEKVHLMFYYAMLTDGVNWLQANTMYQAVKNFGPAWDEGVPTSFETSRRPISEVDAHAFVQRVRVAADQAGDGASPQEVERYLPQDS
ncbi:MAG TPA: hypothetical protein DDW52_21805 [Planctomycetaceae bacterium]|nr:hypothetical protein [Planctomycetaceae bacterium]